MSIFFRGWRRKAGCVALLMALVLMSTWIRSLVVWDWVFIFPTSDVALELKSDRGRLGFEGRSLMDWEPSTSEWLSGVHSPHFGLFAYLENQPDESFVWRWDCAGFSIGRFSSYDFVAIPYWSLVVPLTLLSAYLFFWQPRTRPRSDVDLEAVAAREAAAGVAAASSAWGTAAER